MHKWIKGLRCLWYFLYGNILVALFYDRRYISGRWFEGKLWGIFSTGWEWVVKDTRMNRKLGSNKDVPWPVFPQCRVVCPQNIYFHPDNLDNFQSFGIYFQANGRIDIGHGTYIAPNVGIITANHDQADLNKHLEPKPVKIGKNCWIGMNSVILPGVVLGDNVIVGAGSIVTKSFEKGNCVIVGNPAKIVKKSTK